MTLLWKLTQSMLRVNGPYNEAAGFQGQGADTVILVTVTAADLATDGTHMITVSRDAADD